MRAFIAITLPEEIKEHLSRTQLKLRRSGADARWVSPAHMHLTLNFLGDITQEQASQAHMIMDEAADRNKRFILSLGKLGAFPKLTVPRVVWISVDKGSKETGLLWQDIAEGLQKNGFVLEDKPFTAHVTLARITSPLNRDALADTIKALNAAESLVAADVTVNGFVLYKSTLTPHGPLHEKLHEATLQK
jgi:RNA 2',3'-cyclic 3'-phosphodiesterase